MTVTALLTGRNAMKIMWNRDNVTGECHSAVDVTDSQFVVIGKVKADWGKVNTFYTRSAQMAK